MSNSTSADAAKLFQKRRRAYIACSNCRRRKIKCITASDADYRPCTRCSQKGLTCEYIAVPDDDSPTAESFQAAPAHSGRDASPGPEQWPQNIRPPSAGLSAFMPDARGSRKSHSSRGHAPASAGAGPSNSYRPPNWPADASPVASIAQPRHGSRPQATGAGPYLSSGMPGFQVAAPQYSGQASYGGVMGPNYPGPAMSTNYPPTNYGQPAYRGQPGGSAYAYTTCVCPPGGPCYCGANYARQ